jgi:hypothetical protein
MKKVLSWHSEAHCDNCEFTLSLGPMVIPYPGMLIISVLEAFGSMLESFTPFYFLSNKQFVLPPSYTVPRLSRTPSFSASASRCLLQHRRVKFPL